MRYQVHKLEVNKTNARQVLEQFLNILRGEVVSVVPFVTPKFMMMGGTSTVAFFLVVERV
ncbi:MAG TPA: hypothetical protein PKE63_00725 [Lacibacter sp.]|nr:hypothetical protein [Lacibacter sp.]HMO88324.1 hypothetical protein [Lacibacter sp.]HMP85766.1 hypothetical protein [Lacibacter sp.]